MVVLHDSTLTFTGCSTRGDTTMTYCWPDSDITIMDGFCGAGGSSLGCEYAGARVKLALNHSELSLATHAYNFPHAEHAKVDISEEDPKNYPHTTLAWFSPECTNHSTSKGIKLLGQNQLTLWTDKEEDPFIERSRATMGDVCRWTEAKEDQGHPFELVFVENIPKVRLWRGYTGWLKEMHRLGYEHKTVYFNSMFAPPYPAPVPQSRDRWYTVFWRKGNPAPVLDMHPPAHCQRCDLPVQAVQCWKSPARPHGDYKRQYVYCCPICAQEVTPSYYPASTVIDWSLPLVKVGERALYRKRKLKPKTFERIQIGLERFCNGQTLTPFLVETCHTRADGAFTRPVTEACFTQTTAQSTGVVMPSASQAAFLMSYYKKAVYRTLHDAVGTCTAKDRHALITFPQAQWPEIPSVDECGFRMLTLPEIKKAMGFPDSYTIVCTSAKEGVRQCGLAVTPAVAAELVRRGIESLGYCVPLESEVSA
jgi:DNA (cytosine-5)-methyltransferase 1